MTMTITLPLMLLAGFSALLFLVVTVLCHRRGFFDSCSGVGAGFAGLFLVVTYAILWAVPSLLAWAVWATWFK